MKVDPDVSPESFGADFDPLSEAFLADPYPFMNEARKAAPAFYCDAIDHWIVTRYRDIRHIFRTPALFSATNMNSPLRPPCPMAAKALDDGGFRAVPALNVDPPAHTRVRKIANVAFTLKRVAEMEGFVRDLAVPSAPSACAMAMPTSFETSPGNFPPSCYFVSWACPTKR